MKSDIDELEDIANHFDSMGKPDNANFLRGIALRHRSMQAALQIYTNPFDRGFNVPDFYSEMEFSRFALEAMK